ncbi:MAG: CobD/CbiB family cobalamin biosynthesis protein [Planctomycetota bacterium]|nr:CobD/CbiB family cobalamin biosynthesis protein [Planctomycetota bacterium]
MVAVSSSKGVAARPGGASALTALVLAVADRAGLAWLAGAAVLWMTIGWRSLFEHLGAVARAADLETARVAVSRVVGRDVEEMSAADVHRAALESLAENASDAVIAPLLWSAIGGPWAAATYRWINTLDAMWGHRTPAYERFGWAAARADDLASWLPSRLTAGLYFLAAGRWPAPGWRHQAARHSSPNAGWPETALAHCMGVRLGGPVRRSGHTEKRPWMGPDGAGEPTEAALHAGLRLTQRVLLLGAVPSASLALVACG